MGDGTFLGDLARRVAIRSESQKPPRPNDLRRYLKDEMVPELESLGFQCTVHENPIDGAPPLMVARRIEAEGLPTLLAYGHGDVVPGYDARWTKGAGPWDMRVEEDRIYGRGTADNKGQHSVLIAAIAAVLATSGRLGCNVKILIEMAEETGSVGLRAFCEANRELLAADLFIGCDGPRVSAGRPTLFLGSRGLMNIDLRLKLRDGSHHSGNWGGALANPAVILTHALASIVDARGRILLPALLPDSLTPAVRAALKECQVGGDPGDPETDPGWGEPALTIPEKVYGWNTFEILAMVAGDPAQPANAVPPEARAHCQIRFVVGSDWENFIPAIRTHLTDQGFGAVEVVQGRAEMVPTRLPLDHPRVAWAVASIRTTLGCEPAILPNLGGGLPNDIFANVLELPTLWVPHSYPGCLQHGPDEHNLIPILTEGLAMMTGLLWDFAND